jgi:hypothetical protein
LQDSSVVIIGTYEETAPIAYQFLLYLNIGAVHPPRRFGGEVTFGSNGQLSLNFSNPATGDGDISVYIEYSIINK